MSKFKFINEHDYRNTKTEISFEAMDLSEIVTTFGDFLRACSFDDEAIKRYIKEE